jgi:hypothetical protein
MAAYGASSSMSSSRQIRLPHLKLKDLFGLDWECLVGHLPNIVYLQELSILSINFRHLTINDEVVSGFRRNGSLHGWHVSTDPSLDRPVNLTGHTARRQRLVAAFHARNEHVPKLLKRCQTTRNRDIHALPLCQQESCPGEQALEASAAAETTRTEAQLTTSSTLVPPLYQSMMAAPRMAPHTILIGLMALGTDNLTGSGSSSTTNDE